MTTASMARSLRCPSTPGRLRSGPDRAAPLVGIRHLLELPPFCSGMVWTNTTTTTPVHSAQPSAYSRSAPAAHRVVGGKSRPTAHRFYQVAASPEADREGLDLDAGLTLHPYGRSFLADDWNSSMKEAEDHVRHRTGRLHLKGDRPQAAVAGSAGARDSFPKLPHDGRSHRAVPDALRADGRRQRLRCSKTSPICSNGRRRTERPSVRSSGNGVRGGVDWELREGRVWTRSGNG